jgi:alpha-glucosidase
VKRRTFIALGAGVAVAGITAAAGAKLVTGYVPDAALDAGPMTHDQDYRIRFGRHRLEISGGRWTVTAYRAATSDEPKAEQVVWRSGRPFQACAGDVRWLQRDGHITAQRRVERLYQNLRIDSVDPGEAGTLSVAMSLATTSAFTPSSTIRLVAELKSDDDGLAIGLHADQADAVIVRFDSENDPIHAAGEQFTSWDLRGRDYYLIPREQGIGRGKQPLTFLEELTEGSGGDATATYAPLPYLITDSVRAWQWDGAAAAEVDLRNSNEAVTLVWSQQFTMRVEDAATPATLVSKQAKRSGLAAAPAPWTGTGAIVNLGGGTTAVRDQLAALVSEIPAIAAVWLNDWTGTQDTAMGRIPRFTWQTDTSLYGDLTGLVGELARQNIHCLSYVNPFVQNPLTQTLPRNLYGEARAAGFLVRDTSGSEYSISQRGVATYAVDFTNPDAAAWFEDVLVDQMAVVGPDGWFADLGDTLPFDAVLAQGDAGELHNTWPRLWAELNQRAARRVQAATGSDTLPFVWLRTASPGSVAAGGALCTGDQLTDYSIQDGLESALWGMLHGGLSGLSLNHFSIGGDISVDRWPATLQRSADLLNRSAQFAAWTPFFRTSRSNLPDFNPQVYDADQAQGFATQSRVFAALADYRTEVIEQATTLGLPAIRPCWLEFPGTKIAEVFDQYFYGSRFLVAPVFGATNERTVTLPPGSWTMVWDGIRYKGDASVLIEHIPNQIPAFFRSDDTIAAHYAKLVRSATL